MYTDSLESVLLDELVMADEAWIAVGLMNTAGLDYLNNTRAHIHLLVGIDLPTPPVVLSELMLRARRAEIDFKVYSSDEIFYHPKLYVIRRGKNYKAFVGSGNFTTGGWRNNIELFWTVDKETDCLKLIDWFKRYMETAIIVTEQFIEDYNNDVFRPAEGLSRQMRSGLAKFKSRYHADYTQFFRQEDFDAFAGDRPTNKNEQAKAERWSVKEKLYELHDHFLYPVIKEKGWELHPHHRRANLISLHYHSRFNSHVLEALWLYYGKSPEEVAACNEVFGTEDSPNDHIRLQIIIRHDRVGIWCAVGKDNGSRIDRAALQEKLQDEQNRQRFYELFKELSEDYFIEVAGTDDARVGQIKNAANLYNLVSQDADHLDKYFIIGLDVFPADERLRYDHIKDFIITEFTKLYPLYLFIKADPPIRMNNQ